MAELQMACRDIWVKYTDKHGKSHTAYHRVWDVGLFMEARQREAIKEGGKAAVEQVMEPQKKPK